MHKSQYYGSADGIGEFLKNCKNLLVYPKEQGKSVSYVSVLAGGCSFKIRPTHRSIDDTLINTAEIRWMIISCD